MDATVGFININQNKRVSKLTAISVVFVPINIIGDMSGCSMMTADIAWPVSCGAFTLAMGALSFGHLPCAAPFRTAQGLADARWPSAEGSLGQHTADTSCGVLPEGGKLITNKNNEMNLSTTKVV